MTAHRIVTVLLGVSVLALGACSDSVLPRTNLAGAKYWERSDASSSVYLEGPKAQQMLQRDISRCVTEIRELERLGSIRHAMPADPEPSGGVPDLRSPEGALEQYETPRRQGYLYSEYYGYHDFETCMQSKGWERVQYLPYDRAEQSRKDYVETITRQQYRTKNTLPEPKTTDNVKTQTSGEYNGLNN